MVLNIFIGAYGALTIIAGILQSLVKNIVWWSGMLLEAGGALMISSLFFSGMTSVIVLAVGALLAQLSAIINNFKLHGEINKTHHFSRMIASVLLIVAQWMSIQ